MMIRTAGGPGLVSPIDFHERRATSLSRTAWTAIGVVALAHLAVGAALYHQRFELKSPPPTAEGPVIEVTTWTPPPRPAVVETPPAAPNAPVHRTAAPPQTVETTPVVFNDTPAATGAPVVTLNSLVKTPVENAPPAGTAEAEPTPAPVIRSPSWQRQPTAEQMMRAYPNRALARNLGGSASLSCLVQPSGSVTNCEVIGETPATEGFGRAAQNLSRHFRIHPRTVDGAPQGSRVIISLRFVPPGD